MSRQYFGDLPYADPQIADASAIVATTETGLIAVAQYAPVPAGDARAGKIYFFKLGGIYTTGASGTLIITPRWGTSTGGTSLGASVTQTVPVSLTNEPWYIDGFLQFRVVNNGTASSSSAALQGVFLGGGIAGTASTGCTLPFGGATVTTLDTTTSQGLWLGWTLSVAGSCTVRSCIFGSLN